MLKVVKLTHKYHLVMNKLLSKQNEDRRLAAIEAGDDLEYARTFYAKEIVLVKTALEVEDLIFDYFGIIEAQFEAANQIYKEDASFLEALNKIRESVKAQVEEEYGFDDSKKLDNLDKASALKYMERIRNFTQQAILEASRLDPATGRRLMN